MNANSHNKLSYYIGSQNVEFKYKENKRFTFAQHPAGSSQRTKQILEPGGQLNPFYAYISQYSFCVGLVNTSSSQQHQFWHDPIPFHHSPQDITTSDSSPLRYTVQQKCPVFQVLEFQVLVIAQMLQHRRTLSALPIHRPASGLNSPWLMIAHRLLERMSTIRASALTSGLRTVAPIQQKSLLLSFERTQWKKLPGKSEFQKLKAQR